MTSLSAQLFALYNAQALKKSRVQANLYYDPHFIGFNNQYYSSQFVGDAILYQDNDVEINVRCKLMSENCDDYGNSPTVAQGIAFKIFNASFEYDGVSNTFFIDKTKVFPTADEPIPIFFQDKRKEDPAYLIIHNQNRFSVICATHFIELDVYNANKYNLNVTLKLLTERVEKANPSLFGNMSTSKVEKSYGIELQGKGIFQELRPLSRKNVTTTEIEVNQIEKMKIEEKIRSKGIREPIMIANMVNDYFSTPKNIRDALLDENIPSMNLQIESRIEIKAESKEVGYLESLEKRVSQLEMRFLGKLNLEKDMGRLESLEERIKKLENFK